MSDDSTSVTGENDSLSGILGSYYQSVEAGNPEDPEVWIARYPKHADELREHFLDQRDLDRIARPLQRLAAPHAVDASTPTVSSVRHLVTARAGQRFGDYEILEEIARGGMGVVFKARQLRLNRLVALKLLSTGPGTSKEDVLRFRLEAEAAANLAHPNIVPIHEIDECEGSLFMSMKLVEGGSLVQYQKNLQASPRTIARLLAQVARAVHFAHERGILHRDLKPGNILLEVNNSLLSTDYTPYVTDFGLAKRLKENSSLTQTGAAVGTPSYMAPEQAAGDRDLTAAVDVYGLGGVLYFLLTGQRPFEAETPMATLLRVQTEAPKSPHALHAGVPRDLETICLKCLEKKPQDRYQSADELASDLERFIQDKPIHGRRRSVWNRALRWSLGHPAAAILMGLLAIAGLAGIGGAVHQGVAFYSARRALREEEDRQWARKEHVRLMTEYAESLAQAQKALAEDRAAAVKILDGCPPKLRHWEWHLLRRQAAGIAPKLIEPVHPNVREAYFVPKSDAIACHEQSGEVVIWRRGGTTKLGACLPIGIAVTPDGSGVLGASADGIVLWNTSSRKASTIARPAQGDLPQGLAAGSGRRAIYTATGAQTYTELVDYGQGTSRRWKGELAAQRLAFLGTTKLLGLYTASSLRAWDLDTPSTPIVWEVDGIINRFALSADEAIIAYGATADRGKLYLIATKDWSTIKVLSPSEPILWGLAFSPDGRRLVSASDQRLQAWDVETGINTFNLPLPVSPHEKMIDFDSRGHILLLADGGLFLLDGTPLPE